MQLLEAPVDRRLTELGFQAAKGRFGEPVRFLAGVEVEIQFKENEEDPLDPARLDTAREHLSQDLETLLEPTIETPEDQATLDLWRQQLPDFNAQDLLNALVYITLSRPTLRPGARPPADDYNSVLAHTKATGGDASLDFRFGRKPYAFSFYDDPRVSEFSILPVRLPQIAGRLEQLRNLIDDEAWWYGCELDGGEDLAVGLQPNLSAYHQVKTENGMRWMPVIGRDPSLRSTTADAMAGLTMGIEDGAWFSSVLGQVDHNLAGEETREREYPFTVGVARSNALRINHQWVENRSTILQTPSDIRHSFLWMMAAITYGLEKGADAIGAMPDRSKPELRPTIVTTRTENFDERVDAPLRQMLQSCSIIEGRFQPDPQFVQTAGREFAAAMTGKWLSIRAAGIFTNLFINGLKINKEGRLQVEESAIIPPRIITPDDRAILEKSADTSDIQSLFLSAAVLAARDGFRATIQDTLHSTANYPVLSADEWAERLSESEIFNRAHGEYAAGYAKRLGELLKNNPHHQKQRLSSRPTSRLNRPS